MSMMVPSIFSASINRAAVLNNRDGSSIRDGASRRHGLDVSRHDLEDGSYLEGAKSLRTSLQRRAESTGSSSPAPG
ncbi:hypothetical protein E4U35_000348 [Claviceps purpurea]|nr:hypothetical protein E4U10_002562 [Claviceps purpurea]KAG6208117.1 hypothetical protein E4U35_000348 [Claviceps purpurea]KAG6229344.1 hypothetical protein E4U25_007437 [Claviceps purpurea]KAG6247541.1 hypothetical protein E4U24_003126 [Claviceps purpurea]